MAFTEVILTANISSLGAEADIVKVRRGYARNFLLPNGKALEINSGSLRQINHLKAKRAEREAREVTAADELASKINKLSPVFTLDAGETGVAEQLEFFAQAEFFRRLAIERREHEALRIFALSFRRSGCGRCAGGRRLGRE